MSQCEECRALQGHHATCSHYHYELTFPWYLAPLDLKYYGTKVCYNSEEEPSDRPPTPGEAEFDKIFEIWQPDHFAVPFASDREIAAGWVPADGHDHVEDVQSYTLACNLVEHLNSTGIQLKDA